MIGGSSPGRG